MMRYPGTQLGWVSTALVLVFEGGRWVYKKVEAFEDSKDQRKADAQSYLDSQLTGAAPQRSQSKAVPIAIGAVGVLAVLYAVFK